MCTTELHLEPLGSRLASKFLGFAKVPLLSQSKRVRGADRRLHSPNAFLPLWGRGSAFPLGGFVRCQEHTRRPAMVTTLQQVCARCTPNWKLCILSFHQHLKENLSPLCYFLLLPMSRWPSPTPQSPQE